MQAFVLICAAGTSNAQSLEVVEPDSEIINEQIDLNADIVVESRTEAEIADAATSNANALGNTLSVHSRDTDVGVTSDQQFGGRASADAQTDVNGAGIALSTSASIANTTTVTTDTADAGVLLRQDVTQGSEVTSRATTTVRGGADSAIAAAQSAANNAGLLPGYGTTGEGTIIQSSGAESVAVGRIVGDGAAPWVSSATGLAVGNSISAGEDTTRVLLDAEQTNTGAVRGKAFIDADVANETIAASQAAGNNIAVENDYRYAGLNARQDNQADVNARSEVSLIGFNDVASISASGVGNSTTVSNIGSSIGADIDQTNSGRVRAVGSFDGGTGSTGLVTTTAFGNAASAYACSDCEGAAINGSSRQVNDGKVVSRSTASAYSGALLSSSATAVGNSASYEVTNSRGD